MKVLRCDQCRFYTASTAEGQTWRGTCDIELPPMLKKDHSHLVEYHDTFTRGDSRCDLGKPIKKPC